MAGEPKKPGRGGRRKGAGRKPFLSDTRALTVTLEGADYDVVERLAQERGVSLSTVVRAAVRAYVKRHGRK